MLSFKGLKEKIAISLGLTTTGFVLAVLALEAIFDPSSKGFEIVTNGVPSELLDQVVAQNYSDPGDDPLDKSGVEVLEFSGRTGPAFYIFDFNTTKLCGLAGCLYTVYADDGTRALTLFLHSNVPDKSLFQISTQPSSGLPCLSVHQPTQTDTVVVTKYCYQPNQQAFTGQVQYHQQITE